MYSLNFYPNINRKYIREETPRAPGWSDNILIRIFSVFFKALKIAGSGMSTFVATKAHQGADKLRHFFLLRVSADYRSRNDAYKNLFKQFSLDELALEPESLRSEISLGETAILLLTDPFSRLELSSSESSIFLDLA